MAHPCLQQGGRTAAAKASQTLCGHTFSAEHHRFLCAIAQTRGWADRVWVPVPVVERLSLRLADSPFTPARLVSSNGSVCVYHSSQFVEPLDVLRERWKAHVRGLENAEKDRNAALLASQAAPDALPLSTNGERFDSATEECMLRIMSSRANASRYWATEAEAKWLYRAPFTDAHLSDPGNRVVSHANELCRPMALYNVAGTADPSRFTPLTCRRYDPVNYAGRFYRPAVAVRMKAFALQYNCLHERQWITQRRAMGLGLSILPHIPLLAFSLDMPLFLINIGATHRRSAPAPRVSPAIAADCIVTSEDVLEAPERQCERRLLLPSLS
ncbi:conserved hypothetical protein [Leishmania infantum JPCM5]|uniref:Trypanosoma Tc-38 (p38) protein domain-containing protein n=2 Tax=Leishmania infantum TaxID=5671 RepID=A4HWQ8_LEIIN|nr:conserved hypothetical protein [Leishmania infantum JPCM5]CAC9474068.1 hypothetical_protein_-_conserved [Leishmania infantum]CAM66888.1 conserved hypothetical protein [Leishmania infantum JPCM5]SUZ40587.1 hypothetical_protein_-_conserved [Leishmania infantum]|eukprot:XP_001464499.1 conserved hypothetical protein [Leishmania infantum JPCM5]